MDKVRKIIHDNFDDRVALMVMAYLLGQLGMDQAKTLTDDEINSVKGNAMMTDDFVHALMRTAREIAKTCDFVDVVKYIVTEFDYLTKEE